MQSLLPLRSWGAGQAAARRWPRTRHAAGSLVQRGVPFTAVPSTRLWHWLHWGQGNSCVILRNCYCLGIHLLMPKMDWAEFFQTIQSQMRRGWAGFAKGTCMDKKHSKRKTFLLPNRTPTLTYFTCSNGKHPPYLTLYSSLARQNNFKLRKMVFLYTLWLWRGFYLPAPGPHSSTLHYSTLLLGLWYRAQ